MESLSQFVAQYALTKSSFPAEAIDKAKTFILDSLGVGIAGAQAPFSKIVYTSVQKWGAGDDAHIWGRGERRPQASAAYLNGFQIHSMEFDCVHEPAVVHPMATILAALGSEADKTNCSGQAFLEAIIIAVDIAVELGVAATSGLKFFRPATAGLFGATLGIARLRGLDQDTTLSAMGCALAQTAGVMQAHVEGKPTLPVQIAGAARAAVVACDLAEAGLEGPVSSLAGPYGYFAMFEDQADMDSVRRHLGQIHRITEVSWKPFPTGRAAQGGIVCVQDLRKQGLTLANLKHLTLSAPPIIHRLVAREAVPDMTANYARLCFAYLAAMTLKTGSVSLQDFTPKSLNDREILDAAAKVSVEINHITDPAEFVPQHVRAELIDGRELKASIDVLFGSPAYPLTHEQHIEKFEKCVAFGLRYINAHQTTMGLIDLVDKLEDLKGCRELFALAAGK